MPDVARVGQDQRNDTVVGTHLQFAGFVPELRVDPAAHKLLHSAQLPGVGAIADQERVNQLFREDMQGDLAGSVRREAGAQPFFLPLEDAQDHGFEKRILVIEAAIDGTGCQSSVCGDAGNRCAFDAVLSEHFGGCFHQFAQRLPATCLLRLQVA